MHLHKIILGTSTVWVQHARSLDETSLSNAVLSVCTFFFTFLISDLLVALHIYIHHFFVIENTNRRTRTLTRLEPAHPSKPPTHLIPSPLRALSLARSLCLSISLSLTNCW